MVPTRRKTHQDQSQQVRGIRLNVFAAVLGFLVLSISPALAVGLPAPPRDYQPAEVLWNAFLSGQLELRCNRRGHPNCPANADHTASVQRYLNREDYEGAARLIVFQIERGSGLDPADYFYYALGLSAERLGHIGAAVDYYRRAQNARESCLNYGRANDGHTCGGAVDFRTGWLDSAVTRVGRQMDESRQSKLEEEQSRQETLRLEQEAREREQRLAFLRANFPEEWVDDIFDGNPQIGFTRQAVSEAMGEPTRQINTPGNRSLWVYPNRQIIFDGDTVSQITQQ